MDFDMQKNCIKKDEDVSYVHLSILGMNGSLDTWPKLYTMFARLKGQLYVGSLVYTNIRQHTVLWPD